MSTPRIGSLCSGYGGLDMAVQEVFGGDIAWFFEYDKAPSKILAHHWPDVPNYGDMTKADWAAIEQVDILCSGTPCQDLSGAGKRKGMTEGTRSNLWVQMREAIAVQKPSIVIWENVRGAYSACADSEMGRCPRCMGLGGEHRPFLRALGRVLGDLAALGYDAGWGGFRASDVGAPHNRFRVFVVAYANYGRRGKSDSRQWRLPIVDPNRHPIVPDAGGDESERWGRNRDMVRSRSARESSQRSEQRNPALDSSPITADSGGVGRDEGFSHSGFSQESADRAGLADERSERPSRIEWGDYRPAIERWELTLGRRAPSATRGDGRDNGHRLSADFVEWMMGLPEGHVTASQIGLTRNEQLKALGNGVVPQQAAYALRELVSA